MGVGFRVTRKLYKLVFEEDSDLYGAEIIAKAATLGERRSFVNEFPFDENALTQVAYEAKFFISHVVEWNLEDEDGNPLPITVDSLYTLANEWVKLILVSWSNRSMGQQVGEDLGKGLNGGDSTGTTPSMEESLPMESLL